MNSLSAVQTAIIADEVYAIRENDIQKAMKLSRNGLGFENEFTIAERARFHGTTGPFFLKTRTGFGYIAEGQGKRQGEVLIAIRGTVPGIQDIGADLNIGLQTGPSGWPVHAGFNDTFKSFKQDLHSYFANKNSTHVHCVGHSLGGALATLTADFLSENKIAGVSLYTFGSPRTGTIGFSHNLTRKIQAENIYRVHHRSDPVSMIPIFPFSHVPVSTADIALDWPGSLIAPAAHSMKNYMTTIGNTEWNGLRSGSADYNTTNSVDHWLKATDSNNILMFSAKSLWMITKALAWIIKKVLIGVIGTSLAVTATLVDQLAWFLRQGAMASLEIAGYIKSLIAKILQFLGKYVSIGADLTVSFIRWVLALLFSTLQNFASLSLGLINRS